MSDQKGQEKPLPLHPIDELEGDDDDEEQHAQQGKGAVKAPTAEKETVPVFLAVPDGPLPMKQWQYSSVSKIGGIPTVMKGVKTEASFVKVLNAMNRKCSICGESMYLLTQAFAPLKDNTNRMLYVFVCNNWKCISKALAERSIAASATSKEEAKQPPTASASTSSAPTSPSPLSSRAWAAYSVLIHEDDEEALNDEGDEEDEAEPAPVPAEQIPRYSFPPFGLSIIDEPKEDPKTVASPLEKRLIQQAEEKKAALDRGERDEHTEADIKELESGVNLKDSEVDICFERFRSRLAREPSQVLRYGRGIRPLYMNDTETQALCEKLLPTCSLCGKSLVLELQVMPTALYYLKPDDFLSAHAAAQQRADRETGSEGEGLGSPTSINPNAGGVDFGTLSVYTCSGPCTHVVTHSNIGCRGVFVQEEYVLLEAPPAPESPATAGAGEGEDGENGGGGSQQPNPKGSKPSLRQIFN